MYDMLTQIWDHLLPLDVLIAPQYLISCVPIAYVIYRMRRIKIGFWRWLLPKEIYTHKSTLLDVKLFLLGRILSISGLAGTALMTAYFAVAFHGFLETNPRYVASPIVAALLLFLVHDFARYAVHRAFHNINTIWPLHAVHHSAEVMTPIAFYRQHPLGIVVAAIGLAAFSGVGQGMILALLSAELTSLQIAGLNIFFVIGILLMGNFHHSHIWVSFGPIVERLIISPAQHQIHHSTDPQHYNKNYGTTLAIWDWMFGTLYVTQKEETVTFGLTSKVDAPLMTHRFWLVIIDPIKRMFLSQ